MATAPDRTVPTTWCLFQGESRPYAVPLGSVVEVVRFDRLVRLPLGPPWLVGLCSLRRDVIPVFRPSDAEPAVSRAVGVSRLVVVLRVERGAFGLLIDRSGVHVHEGDPDSESPAVLARMNARLIRDGVMHSVIDPEATWQRYQTAIGSWYHPKEPGVTAGAT